MVGAHTEFASYAHGSKAAAVISTSAHTLAKPRIFNDQRMERDNVAWAFPQPEQNPYQLEWEHLTQAIRDDRPYNEVQRGVEASLAASMGRMAAHTGRVITRDQILNGDHEFAPGVDSLTLDGPAPLQANAEGKYPVPAPGLITDREYAVL